jgi:chloramphenicol O-acetyltransferase
VGIIFLPIFLPIGAVLIFMALYGDFTKKYIKEVEQAKEEKKFKQDEFGTDVLEQGI